jgi:hypothetical protein
MFRTVQAVLILVLAMVLTVGWWSVAGAADTPAIDFSKETYEKAFKILFIAFVVALLLESGLAVLFNWRPFLMLFDARGVRTVVSVLFGYIFVKAFDIDIVRELVAAYSSSAPKESEFGSQFISALILAGGSAGVNKLLIGLGFRQVKTVEEVVAKPPPTHAWISVALTRNNAKGPVDVNVGQAGTVVVAGTIASSSRRLGILTYFIRDYGRFPPSGGFAVNPNIPVTVQLIGVDENNAIVQSPIWSAPGLAAGAIVDLRLAV